MNEMLEKLLMQLPSEIRLSLASGRYSLYTLPQGEARGSFLLAISHDDTFYVSSEGRILERAGKLGEVKVEDVVRVKDADKYSGFKANIA